MAKKILVTLGPSSLSKKIIGQLEEFDIYVPGRNDDGEINRSLCGELTDTETCECLAYKAVKILNEQYSPGDPAYGIPHPGVFVIDLNNEIVGKIFIESFRERVDGEGTLNYALQMLETESE